MTKRRCRRGACHAYHTRENPGMLARKPSYPREYLVVDGSKLAGTGARFYTV
jgi:hypothetical protein